MHLYKITLFYIDLAVITHIEYVLSRLKIIYMHKLMVSVVLLAALASCGNNNNADKFTKAAPGDSSYTVKGKITGLDSGWVYLYNVQTQAEKPDSVKLDKGNFEFKGSAAEPQFAVFGILGQEDGRQAPLYVFLEPGTITIQAAADSVGKGKVNGGASQQELEKFIASLKPLEEKQKKLMADYQQAVATGSAEKIGEIQKNYEALGEENKALVVKFVKENPASYVSALQLAQTFAYDVDPNELEPLFTGLNEEIKNSHFGKQVKEALESAKKTAIGGVAPEFTLTDVSGKPVSLSSFKGKYTLVDFWASWCGPCRQENPAVVKAYNMYKAKGFEILGVSLDEKKESWEKAIKDDKLAWTQVSDLKGWQSDAAALYGVKGIPMNFLLDKEGKIIAKSLRGEDLIKKLGEVLN